MQQSPWARKPARRRTGLHTLLALALVAVAAGATYLAVVQVPKWLRGPDAAATVAPSPSVSTLDPLPGCRSPGFPDFRSLGALLAASIVLLAFTTYAFKRLEPNFAKVI